MLRMQGIVVGSRSGLEALIRAMSLHNIRPLIDSVFALGRAALQKAVIEPWGRQQAAI